MQKRELEKLYNSILQNGIRKINIKTQKIKFKNAKIFKSDFSLQDGSFVGKYIY